MYLSAINTKKEYIKTNSYNIYMMNKPEASNKNYNEQKKCRRYVNYK